MMNMISQLGDLGVLQLGEGRGWPILASPTLQPLAVLGTHTEDRQCLIWLLALLLTRWTSSSTCIALIAGEMHAFGPYSMPLCGEMMLILGACR